MDCILLYCDNIDKSSAKLAFFQSEKFFETANIFCKGSLFPLRNIFINALPTALTVKKHSILESIFYDVMPRFVSSGIPQYLYEFHADLFHIGYLEFNEKLPKILTLDDLAFGFNLWLLACCLSTIGFICEVFKKKFTKALKDFIGLFYLLKYLKEGVSRNQ